MRKCEPAAVCDLKTMPKRAPEFEVEESTPKTARASPTTPSSLASSATPSTPPLSPECVTPPPSPKKAPDKDR